MSHRITLLKVLQTIIDDGIVDFPKDLAVRIVQLASSEITSKQVSGILCSGTQIVLYLCIE
jgi:hypothetical protein